MRNRTLGEADPAVSTLIEMERTRQDRKIILIPSESICPKPVLEALGSPFSNIYAEGYPLREMLSESEEALLDHELQGARHRRYCDRRFYKGCEHANVVEALARARIRALFATPRTPADCIMSNVQPLSGAAANNAVYSALLQPGDVIMGMSLFHGGHLTHGSELNRSGKTYRAAAYEVSPSTERLDYDLIMKAAEENRPRMIVAGYTSYPWAPDWGKFREIADRVGALLLADVAHPAGMIAAGVFPNPVDFADVVTFTTHKTLFGPRGAVILTTRPEIAEAVDSAVFPGEQGGPHVNTFAAMAAAFRIAGTDEFRKTQKKIVENAGRFASALVRNGLTLAYGGTDTHLLVVDLRRIKTKTGLPLKGDTAVRMLDLAGIVANKNTIPGDDATAEASGVRMGTPWITQRRIAGDAVDELGAVIAELLKGIHPFSYRGLKGTLPRGKVALETLEKARRDARRIAEGLARDERARAGAARARAMEEEITRSGSGPEVMQTAAVADRAGGAGHAPAAYAVLRVRGERALQFCDQIGTNDVGALEPGNSCRSFLLDRLGTLIAPVLIHRLERGDRGIDQFLLVIAADLKEKVSRWLEGLSDGYLLFDDYDILRKVEGPVAVEPLSDDACPPELLDLLGKSRSPAGDEAPGVTAHSLHAASPGLFNLTKPYFIGERFLRHSAGAARSPTVELASGAIYPPTVEPASGAPRQQGAVLPHGEEPATGEEPPLSPRNASSSQETSGERPAPRPSCLYEEHLKLTKNLVEFAGWVMPVRYEGILEEHRAVREAAGLFDVSHMGILEISGKRAERFLDAVASNYVPWLRDGESQYSYLLAPDGSVIDDILIYRFHRERYLIVVNAANAAKDLEWLRGVNAGIAAIDLNAPEKRAPGPVSIRDLKDPEAGSDRLVNIALQGPASPAILESLLLNDRQVSEKREALQDRKILENREVLHDRQAPKSRAVPRGRDLCGDLEIRRLERTRFVRADLAGFRVILSRTGYTGEKEGYEIILHPDRAPDMWRLLLAKGRDFGLKPAGLGARDSLRIEAGLPLYGHEIGGPTAISPIEAGFGPYVKFHKPFFIGRESLLERETRSIMTVVRFRKTVTGTKMAKQGDPVASIRAQKIVGAVTSCALDGEGFQVGMAYVEKAHAREGTRLGVFSSFPEGRGPSTREPRPEGSRKTSGGLSLGSRVPVHDDAVVLSRFPVDTRSPNRGASTNGDRGEKGATR
jgi:glycine hydroxymethyltransferase